MFFSILEANLMSPLLTMQKLHLERKNFSRGTRGGCHRDRHGTFLYLNLSALDLTSTMRDISILYTSLTPSYNLDKLIGGVFTD